MTFSKRSRYGIRALIDLAENDACGGIQLSKQAGLYLDRLKDYLLA